MRIEVSDNDAELFKQFCQYHDLFEFMLSEGVFEMRGGNVIMSVNLDGTEVRIKREVFGSSVYRKKIDSVANL